MIILPKKIHIYIKRFLLVFVVFAVLFNSSCTTYKMNSSGYEIIGKADLNKDSNYNFSETLANLYTSDTSLVLATMNKVSENKCTFTVDEIMFGYLGFNEYTASFSVPEQYGLVEGKQYLLFVKGVGDDLILSVDSAGWLKVEDGSVTSQSGNKLSLERIRFEGEKIDVEIFLPDNFRFYRSLDDLVINSDIIFIGTIQTVRERDFSFYYSNANAGFSRSINSPTEIVFVEIDEMLKGTSVGNSENMLIYDSTAMHSMVVDDATEMAKTINSESDLQPKYKSTKYVFFLKQPPINNAPYAFFTNAIQGMVPIDSESKTFSVFNNPAFTYSMNLEDVVADIWSIVESTKTNDSIEIAAE